MKIERSAKNGSIDRRVARTRALLQDALIALIPERGYAAITVEDICRKANVGRSTFYAHYTSKDELRSATIEAHLRSLDQQRLATLPASGRRLFRFSLPMLEHAQAARELHHALLSSSSDAIHDELRERIRRVVRHELADKRIGSTNVPAEVAVQFISGAFVAVLAWWINGNADLSPSEVDELFQQLALNGVGARVKTDEADPQQCR
ncbi:TetR/AcrR family transcriptional regulator [Rhizobium sullae]|uniref:TetR family transcriptional regulator n=1 Tax=Rhizobium sullae TaxID=50338 RepID=A0A4R3PZU0_RHISU|nr:TetR family transcriptional regulator [Rhizobium sullae]TCU06810.1 TetR family transcriptional regulator [Rhizobium sullae]